MIRKLLTSLTVASAFFIFSPAAEAQSRRTHARTGPTVTTRGTANSAGHWELRKRNVNVPGRHVEQLRTVNVPGRYEWVNKQVVVPGRWDTVQRQVNVPGRWVTVRRPGRARVGFRVGGVSVGLGQRDCEQRVWQPARTETRCERVWVPERCEQRRVRTWVAPCTRQERVRVWQPARCEVRTERVWVADPEPGCETVISVGQRRGRRGWGLRIGR